MSTSEINSAYSSTSMTYKSTYKNDKTKTENKTEVKAEATTKPEANTNTSTTTKAEGVVYESSNIKNMSEKERASLVEKLKADADKDAFIASVTESVKNNRWMCGSPEKFVVIALGDYLITAFGHAGASEFSANTIPTFVNNVKACYASAEVVVEESLIAE